MLQDPLHWMPRLTLAPNRYKTHVSQMLDNRHFQGLWRVKVINHPSLVNGSTDHLIAAWQHQSRPARRVTVRRLDVGVPAHLVSPAQRIASQLVELEPLLAAAIGHPAVQRHVAVVRLRRLVDGQLGLLRSDGGRKEGQRRTGGKR